MTRTVPIIALAIASSLGAQNKDSLAADSAFRRSDWPATARLYAPLTIAAPTVGMNWLRLGMARHALKDIDGATTAYEKALSLNWQVPTTTFRLARVYSLKGNLDKSFTYLDQLVPLGAVPLPILDTLTDLAAARKDPRYKGIADRLTAIRYPCRSLPAAKELDFWIGDWDVSPWAVPVANAPIIGRNIIEPILEHCVLLENWSGLGAAPSNGKSMNFFDTNRNAWRQIWMADGGGSLDYTGSFKDGAMRFEGWTLAPNGQRLLQKLTFTPIHKDTVRQTFESSADSGKTWQRGFDGRYVRRKSG